MSKIGKGIRSGARVRQGEVMDMLVAPISYRSACFAIAFGKMAHKLTHLNKTHVC